MSVATCHLALQGYKAMSLAAVADEARTSRQALYRRWPNKAELVAAVITTIAESPERPGDDTPVAEPFKALVAELADFRRGVSLPGRLSLVGTMLQDSTEPEVVTRYRGTVVAPRRQRLRRILAWAQELGLIDADADIDVAVTMCTGCWYGRALAGTPPPPRWAERAAALVWRAVGGELPAAGSPT